MGILRIPQLNEKQRLFLKDEHKYIAYGGARGGGKSWAVSQGGAAVHEVSGD